MNKKIVGIIILASFASIIHAKKALYASHREAYLQAHNILNTQEKPHKETCVFCEKLKNKDAKDSLIIKNYKHIFVVLNKFPYNKGHLLIIPKKHVPNLSDLQGEEKKELMQVLSKIPHIFKAYLNADGTNIGINLGKAAGASKPNHLHIHALPRYKKNNPNHMNLGFLDTTADTTVVGWNMFTLRDMLKKGFEE